MPRGAWSRKDERQYEHIVDSCVTSGRRQSLSTCKRIAAATVNKQRRAEGRTLDEMVNVESMARKFPETFQVLPLDVRAALEPGDFAKLIFRESGCGERPWVRVTARRTDGRVRYKGIVDNKTSCGPPFGTEVSFGPQNVASKMSPAPSKAPLVLAGVGAFLAWLQTRQSGGAA